MRAPTLRQVLRNSRSQLQAARAACKLSSGVDQELLSGARAVIDSSRDLLRRIDRQMESRRSKSGD